MIYIHIIPAQSVERQTDDKGAGEYQLTEVYSLVNKAPLLAALARTMGSATIEHANWAFAAPATMIFVAVFLITRANRSYNKLKLTKNPSPIVSLEKELTTPP